VKTVSDKTCKAFIGLTIRYIYIIHYYYLLHTGAVEYVARSHGSMKHSIRWRIQKARLGGSESWCGKRSFMDAARIFRGRMGVRWYI